MVDLPFLPKKPSADEVAQAELDDAQKADMGARVDAADRQFVEEARQRTEDLVQFNSQLIKPTRLSRKEGRTSVASKYHSILTQDLKISKFALKELVILSFYDAILDQCVDMELDDLFECFHADMEFRLASYSSVEGFERLALITQIANLQKSSNSLQNLAPRKVL